MIRHLFLMIWNQKRRNLGMILEVFFSFMVLFAVLTFIFNKYSFYRQPIGFDYNNVWVVYIGQPNFNIQELDEMNVLFDQQLRTYPEIENYTFTQSNIPYGNSTSSTSLKINGADVGAHVFTTKPDFKEVLDIEMVSGRWFTEEDRINKPKAVVINSTLAEKHFGTTDLAGKTVNNYSDEPMEILGVVNRYKYQGEFAESIPSFFKLPKDSVNYLGTILLEIKPGTKAEFEAKLMKDLSRVATGWTFEINYMDEMRAKKLRSAQIPMLIFLIIGGFLIFNVALGLFGVLWYNINKRKQEIGVRRAMGATKDGISWQFVGEVTVIAVLSIVLGIFFAIQFPLLQVFEVKTSIYLLAIAATILLILLLVLICSFYPSRQAAKLQPAIALHAE